MVVKLAKILPDLVIYYKDSPIWESLCYFSSYMPSNKVPSLSSLCYYQLQHLPDDAERKEFTTVLESLCNQNASRELLELIQEWVTDGVMNMCASPPAKKRRCKKKVQPKESEGKPYLAARMLSFMLEHRVCQNTLLQTCPDLLIKMLSSLDTLKEKFEHMDKRSCNEYTITLLKENLSNLLKISALLYNTNTVECESFIADFISWCASTLLQHLKCNRDPELQSSGKRRKSRKSMSPEIFVSQFVTDVYINLFQVCTDRAVFENFDMSKCSAILQFCAEALKSESAPTFVFPISKLMHIHYVRAKVSLGDDTSSAKEIPTLFCEIIHALSKDNCIDSIPAVEGKDIQLILSEFILTEMGEKMFQNEYSNLTSLVAESAVGSFTKYSKDVIENKSCKPFKSIAVHGAAAFFFTLMIMKPKVLPLYLRALFKGFLPSEVKIEKFLAYCIILWNLSVLKSVSVKTSTHIANLLNSMKEALDKFFPPEENSANNDNNTDEEDDSMENTESNKASFSNCCKNEFAKLQRQYPKKGVTEKEGA